MQLVGASLSPHALILVTREDRGVRYASSPYRTGARRLIAQSQWAIPTSASGPVTMRSVHHPSDDPASTGVQGRAEPIGSDTRCR